MGTQTKQIMSVEQRRRRHFSDSFKQSKVHEIEAGLTRICDLCKTYQCTTNTVYRWIQKFGSMKKKPERMIIENQSDTQQLLALKKQVAELKELLGKSKYCLILKIR
ncbi:MAG: transposase [Bacteroidetes bacterium]|nr:transposase [Bacteroidota bacterium]